MAKRKRSDAIPGSLYQRNGRWWWRVRLPGDKAYSTFPLKPDGARFATKDRDAAEFIAGQMWSKSVLASGNTVRKVDTMADLVTAYMNHVRDFYRPPSREPSNISWAVTLLLDVYPKLPAKDFGPLKLKELRQYMIDKKDWSRNTINKRVGMIKRMFDWAASEQLIPQSISAALRTVEGLRRGRSGARETTDVEMVGESHVRAVLPYTTPTLAAMIELQLLTGMRSTELCTIRPCDIETSGKVWVYRPQKHKTGYLGHKRVVPIGPKAQKILKPFLKTKLDTYCFTPEQSFKERLKMWHEQRTVPLKYGNAPGTNNKGSRKFVERYNRNSYRSAIQYAIAAARKAGEKVEDWTPHQLRHTAATKIRKEYGLDAARAVLGQRTLQIADEYAELDVAIAKKAMQGIG